MCLSHDWELVEIIGKIRTYRCRKCGQTKTRVKG